MRRIHSSEDKLRKQKRSQLIMGLVLVGLMVLSTLGYAFSGGNDSEEILDGRVEYNGVYFNNYGSTWASEENPQTILANNPNNVSQDFFKVREVSYYTNKPLYIQYNDSLSSFFLYENFNPFILRMQRACFDSPCGEGLPVKNCSSNIIIVEISEQEEVFQQEGCVFIKGSSEKISQLVDSFVLEVFGLK